MGFFFSFFLFFSGREAGVSGNYRSREFPGIPASNFRPKSREWNLPLAFPFPKMGMEFSICIPVPVNGNEIFLGFPGNFPFPKVGNGIFYLFAFPFPKMGMEFAIHIHIPVPENGNGIYHFPFPKSKSHSHSWLIPNTKTGVKCHFWHTKFIPRC